MTLTSTGSKCDRCGRSLDGNDKPCPAANETNRRVAASTTTDETCKRELRVRGY